MGKFRNLYLLQRSGPLTQHPREERDKSSLDSQE